MSYIAVIDVDTANQNVPPGGTAIVTLTAGDRPQAVRISNNALVFAPSAEVLEAVDQTAPILEPTAAAAKGSATRRGRVWKFENGQFVPIVVEVGIADDTWTELVSGDVHPGGSADHRRVRAEALKALTRVRALANRNGKAPIRGSRESAQSRTPEGPATEQVA